MLKRAAATIESLEPRWLLSGGGGRLRGPVDDLAPAAEASYIYTTLDGPAGATYTQANGVSGDLIVGYYIGSDGKGHGFIYNGLTYTTLDDPNAPGVQGTTATGVYGDFVVGYYYDSDDVIHGFTYDLGTGQYSTLNDPNASQNSNQGTFAEGISGSNVVGWYNRSNGAVQGFTYDMSNGSYVTLSDPEAGQASNQGTFATGIAGSDIVGYYYDSTSVSHGFLYDGSTFTPLDDPAAIETRAIGISGSTVVGWYNDSDAAIHGFIYDGTYATLDDPAGSSTHATGIDGTTVVGYYITSSGATEGFFATPGAVTPTGTISGQVINERDGGGMDGITITLQRLKHRRPHGRAVTTTTDRSGDYSFANVVAATYRVSQTLPRRTTLVLPAAGSYTIALAAGQTSSGNNFGDESKPVRAVALAARADTPFATTAAPGTFAASEMDASLLLFANQKQPDVFAD